MCLLTKADVQSSARYQALPAAKRAAADRYATDLCANADAIVASLTPEQKADLLAKYDAAVTRAVPQGWLTPTRPPSSSAWPRSSDAPMQRPGAPPQRGAPAVGEDAHRGVVPGRASYAAAKMPSP